MEPNFRIPVIDTEATGRNIKELRQKAKVSVKDLQIVFGYQSVTCDITDRFLFHPASESRCADCPYYITISDAKWVVKEYVRKKVGENEKKTETGSN